MVLFLGLKYQLCAGEVGYVCGSIKDVLDARVGDTMVLSKDYKDSRAAGTEIEPLPGYADSVPMVYAGYGRFRVIACFEC